MKLGFFGINMDLCARPEVLARVAAEAESAGLESLWAGEHVVLPDPQVPPSPLGPREPVLDPLLALAWAAAETSSIRLATGIVILPQRNPVVLAKQVASLDVLCGGRLTLGLGVGYLEPEFNAVGADFANRGAVTDDFIDAMTHLWYDDSPEFTGRFASFSGVDAQPRPAQKPLPVVIGGHSPAAFRRVVSRGHGWYGFALTPGDTARCLAGIKAAADETERPPALGELEITVTPRGPLTGEMAEEFAAIGVHRLVPRAGPATATVGELLQLLEDAAEAVAAVS